MILWYKLTLPNGNIDYEWFDVAMGDYPEPLLDRALDDWADSNIEVEAVAKPPGSWVEDKIHKIQEQIHKLNRTLRILDDYREISYESQM